MKFRVSGISHNDLDFFMQDLVIGHNLQDYLIKTEGRKIQILTVDKDRWMKTWRDVGFRPKNTKIWLEKSFTQELKGQGHEDIKIELINIDDKNVMCCGEEMLESDKYFHCRICGRRLVNFPHNKDRELLGDLFIEYVSEFDPSWKELQPILHELWKAGHYDGYEPKLPEDWKK